MAKRTCDEIVVGDSIYELDKAYKEGARAMRAQVPYNVGNPYRAGCYSHDQWNEGHCHEAAGEHIRFGVDVIAARASGRCFEEDPSVPRDRDHHVDMRWYEAQLATAAATGSEG